MDFFVVVVTMDGRTNRAGPHGRKNANLGVEEHSRAGEDILYGHNHQCYGMPSTDC